MIVDNCVQATADDCKNLCDGLNPKALEDGAVVDVQSPAQIILSLTMIMLIANGSVNVNQKISKYWPEHLARGGKDVEVRHLLSRSSDADGCDQSITVKNVSELVRRIDGRSLELFVAEELTWSLRKALHQQVKNEPEPENHPQIRLQPLTNALAVLPACSGHASNGVSASVDLTSRKRLYPKTIPSHHRHPCANDFSVVHQDPVGKVLLTHRGWQQGDFMARFDGITMPEVMLHTLQKTDKVHLWDPHFIGNLAHSCNPNVMLDMVEHEMWAIQDIEPGAVLSMDYASTEDHLYRTFQCECNASGCRKKVTGRKQRRSVSGSVDPASR